MNSIYTVHSTSPQDTHYWAQEWVQQLPIGSRVALKGNLGAGKTTLVKGFMEGLGYQDSVTSPSYSLVHEYPTKPPVVHIDLYRLEIDADWEEIGLDYYLFETTRDNICFVEWPERVHGLNIPWTHEIFLQSSEGTGNTRDIQITEYTV